MESVHEMLKIKDERETASALCHRGYLSSEKAYVGSRMHLAFA